MVDVFNFDKLYRLEVGRAPPPPPPQWLTVFDASASAGAVALGSRLTSADGNASANVTGRAAGRHQLRRALRLRARHRDDQRHRDLHVPAAQTLVVVNDLAERGLLRDRERPGGNLT